MYPVRQVRLESKVRQDLEVNDPLFLARRDRKALRATLSKVTEAIEENLPAFLAQEALRAFRDLPVLCLDRPVLEEYLASRLKVSLEISVLLVPEGCEDREDSKANQDRKGRRPLYLVR